MIHRGSAGSAADMKNTVQNASRRNNARGPSGHLLPDERISDLSLLGLHAPHVPIKVDNTHER